MALLCQQTVSFYQTNWNELVRDRARQVGILLEAESVELRPVANLRFKNLGTVFPIGRFPFPLQIADGTLSLGVMKLALLKSVIDLDAQAYGGFLSGEIERPFSGNGASLDFTGSKIQLSAHPLGTGFGVSGELSFSSSGAWNDTSVSPFPNDGKFQIDLKQGSYVGGHKLFGLVALPAVSDLSVSVPGQIKSGRISIPRATLVSSLGTGELRASGSVPAVGLTPTFSGEYSLSLNEAGAKIFAGYLQLLAQGKGTPTTRNWSGRFELKNGLVTGTAEPKS